jgi:hypothetical protein
MTIYPKVPSASKSTDNRAVIIMELVRSKRKPHYPGVKMNAPVLKLIIYSRPLFSIEVNVSERNYFRQDVLMLWQN